MTTRSILSLLQDINKRLGITIVVITHEMEMCIRDRDIITRKAEISPENIVITPIYSKDSAQKGAEKNSENE